MKNIFKFISNNREYLWMGVVFLLIEAVRDTIYHFTGRAPIDDLQGLVGFVCSIAAFLAIAMATAFLKCHLFTDLTHEESRDPNIPFSWKIKDSIETFGILFAGILVLWILK